VRQALGPMVAGAGRATGRLVDDFRAKFVEVLKKACRSTQSVNPSAFRLLS